MINGIRLAQAVVCASVQDIQVVSPQIMQQIHIIKGKQQMMMT
jgi:hypothetical protein